VLDRGANPRLTIFATFSKTLSRHRTDLLRQNYPARNREYKGKIHRESQWRASCGQWELAESHDRLHCNAARV